MIKFKTRFQKVNKLNLLYINEVAKKYNHDFIVKLNFNENKFGTTPKLNILKIKSPNIYPEFRNYKLIETLANKFKLSKDHFYISNGSDAILDALPTLFASAKAKHNVVIPELTFGRIETACVVNDINVKKVDLVNGNINLDKMFEAIDTKTSIVYIVNPCMPTGTLNTKEQLIKFMDKVPTNILVVIDEAYSEYAFGIENSIKMDLELINKYDNLLITHTFSKLYGIASFRIGYAISKPYIIDLFVRALPAFPVNKYSLQAANIVLHEDIFYNDIIKQTHKEIQYLYKEYDRLGLQYFKTNGNFIFIKTGNLKFSNETIQQFVLQDSGIMIKCVRMFALRITVGNHKENVKLINSLRKFFNKNI